MKTAKLMMFLALSVLVSSSFAARQVKSKLGDINVTSDKGGGKVVCTAGFNDALTIVREADTEVLVKGSCGQGWVEKSKIEYIAKAPGDKSMTFDAIGVLGWADNRELIDILSGHYNDDPEVEIDRDFREYLTYTMDREQTEMRNGEN
jgi:hypothetical protein